MSDKQLTTAQKEKLEKLQKEFIERAEQIPESPRPHNKLDGGGGPFHDLGVEFQKRWQQIIDEE